MWRFKYTFMQYERQWEGLGFVYPREAICLANGEGMRKMPLVWQLDLPMIRC